MSHRTPKWQTVWLLAGFGLLIGLGVVTVLLPELRDEPEPELESSSEDFPTDDRRE
jgi:hypothetical protein